MKFNFFTRSFLAAIFSLGMVFSLQAQDPDTLLMEDFDGGIPADWSTVEVLGNGAADAVWFHTTVGPTGAFPMSPIASTTAANGWALFDSDLNCNIGVGQDAWLISPEVDYSAEDEVWLVFQSRYRKFFDTPFVRIGSDLMNLSSWESIEMFPDSENNDVAGDNVNPHIVRLDITDVVLNQVQPVRIAFQFLSDASTGGGTDNYGCAYSWQIDDVAVVNGDPRPAGDIQVNTFFAVAPNAMTPKSQVEPIGFIADVQNVSADTILEALLRVRVTDQNDMVVFTDSLIYTNIGPDSLAENVFFPNEWTPPAEVNTYTIIYSIENEAGDPDLTNNVQGYIFEVTEDTFAKERGATRSVAPADDDSYTYGNIYYMVDGFDYLAKDMTFGVANADELADVTISTFLYEWDGVYDETGVTISEDDLTAVAFNSYTFDGTEGQDLITIPVDLDSNLVALTTGMYYIPAVQYTTDTDQALFLLASEDYDYAGLNFYTDSLDRERFGAILDVGNTGSLRIDGGFGLDIVPVMRLTLALPTATKEPILPDGAVTLFPNPIKDAATLDVKLEEATEVLELTVYDQAGRKMWQSFYRNVVETSLPIDASKMANGSYMLRVRTDQGISTIKMIVQH